VGGPRAGDTGSGSTRSLTCATNFLIGLDCGQEVLQQPEVAKSAKAMGGFALGKRSERNEPNDAATVGADKWKLRRDSPEQLPLRRMEISWKTSVVRASPMADVADGPIHFPVRPLAVSGDAAPSSFRSNGS